MTQLNTDELLPENDFALRAWQQGNVQLALDILCTGTDLAKADALLLLHNSSESLKSEKGSFPRSAGNVK